MIRAEFETKPNLDENIIQTQAVHINNVSGNIEQTRNRFVISLEGNEEVIEVFRYIWEMAALYDGYFYTPCKYSINGADENPEKLYYLSFCRTGKTWKNCASTLLGSDKDFSESTILRYSNFRNRGRQTGDMQKALINSFFYIHSDAYEHINVNHRLSLLLNICDGFVINTSGPNNNVKANIAKVIGTTLDSKVVKYGATLLGIPSAKMYDALCLERHEIDHYIHKEGSLSDYALKSNSKNFINWYFVYVVELALRIAFLKQIGCHCKEELVESTLDDINDWLILEGNLPEKCKNPINQMTQDLKNRGIIVK